MHHHTQFMPLEVDAIVAQAEAVQGLAATLQLAFRASISCVSSISWSLILEEAVATTNHTK